MNRYNRIMNVVSKAVMIVTGVLICLMVLTITYQVAGRFFFNKTPRWSEELSVIFLLYAGLLGAASAYRERLHIGIKFFIEKTKGRVRNGLYFLIDIFIGSFALFMLIYGSSLTWVMRNQTMPATKIPVAFSYLPIPLAGMLILLFVVEKIVNDVKGRPQPEQQIPAEGV
ncbi:MAG: TRAP transporter small permease [Spirochaetales bacterium]|nr:TRAP transporter small permease [Spirochaetales bacterium]